MPDDPESAQHLVTEIEELKSRLAEPEETLDAIRRGIVDAFVVSEGEKQRVLSLASADPPYRLIVEEMGEGAATLDEAGTILFANRRLAELVAVPLEFLRGRFFRAFVADAHLGVFEELLALAGNRHEVTLRREDGVLVPVQLSVSRLRETKEAAYCLIATDVSEQKKQAALAAEAEARKEASRRKDEFLAVLGHELRNPLAALGSAAEMLREPSLPAERADWARGTIERQLRLLTHMVNDLLDVSRIERGRIELAKEDVDLGALVARVASSYEALAGENRKRLTVSVPEREVFVRGDAGRLSQILSNLIDNAIKYTGDGGRISVVLSREGSEAHLRVSDDGAGIPREMLARVFELFTQVGRPGSSATGGLGIGLAIVRTLVELHGGTVHAVSDGPGRGTELLVTFPRLVMGSGASHKAVKPPRPRLRPRRILLVEDHEDAAEGMKLLLETAGHEVVTAGDGARALSCCETFRPELILLDIGLPDMDGYDVGRELRARLGESVLIVALTGFGAEEDRRRSADARIDHHVLKPVSVEQIEDLLARDEPAL